jgi:hypothetical protein
MNKPIRGKKQKFYRYDLVWVDADLSKYKTRAIVMHSYKDQYNSRDERDREIFALLMPDGDRCAWYGTDRLTLIDIGRVDLAEEWEPNE